MSAFKVGFLKEAEDFLKTLPPKAYDKIIHNIERVAGGERNIELFKKLEGAEIWEFRTLYGGVAYRLFAFWDTEKETMVVATHGIVKKTQKTPRKEIAKAEMVRKRYFENKNKQK
ncbi:MAG: type II toxin-antitoxin system RelE/ParE family toxin [Bacteroidales bacterium]|nr:type II toxin-antitoxin system RelE/ParE family toxin [Bacteroidales bacterium]